MFDERRELQEAARIGPTMEDRRSWINGSRAAATIRLTPPEIPRKSIQYD